MDLWINSYYNSSKTTFEESLAKFKQRLRIRGYPKTIIERSLSGVNFASRPSALTETKKANERILPFVTTYHQAVSNLKQTLMERWNLVQNQPLLKTIYLKPPILSYKRGTNIPSKYPNCKFTDSLPCWHCRQFPSYTRLGFSFLALSCPSGPSCSKPD